MLYGMTYEQYWNGSPYLAKYFCEKHKLEIKEKNQQLWLQGLYIYNAVSVALSNAFGKHSNAKYLEEPIDIIPPTEEEMQEREEKEFIKSIRALDAFQKSWEAKQK